MNQPAEELDPFAHIMAQHVLWLESGGEQGKRAVLREMDFSGVDVAAMGVTLAGADCTEANFSGAHLVGVNCSGANMNLANFSEAQLEGADFSGANLVGATLLGAKARSTNFHNAALREVRAQGANLTEANLESADLRESDLSNATLDRANMQGAQCRSAAFGGVLFQHVDLSSASDVDLRYVAESLAMERDALEQARLAFEKQQNEKGEAAKMREAGLSRREQEVNQKKTGVEAKQALEEKVARRLFEYSAICKYMAMSWFIITATLGTLMGYLYTKGTLPMSDFEIALTALGAMLILGMHLFAAISAFKEYQEMMKTLNARVEQ